MQPRAGEVQPGMTLRDYFAGQALAGMLANKDLMLMIAQACREVGETDGHAAIAGGAYDYADAMLSARQETRHGE
jgi:hypothetical protein